MVNKLTDQDKIDVSALIAEIAQLKRVIAELESDKRVLEAQLHDYLVSALVE